MNSREQFGKYLLLKKLGEDHFGEFFRAGRISSEGLEEVTLLRVFNGNGIDGESFLRRAKERNGLHDILRSPNIARSTDFGEVNGIPFVTYDYLSGQNLATLLAQAKKKRSPIPTDHALLITERIALALAVGYETRFQGQRVLHSCLTPNLVVISNEGETRVLGFGLAPAIRAVATLPQNRKSLGQYLAPEIVTGAEPSRSDDVYSLGVMLLEMLSGQPLDFSVGAEAAIDSAILGIEGSPLPDDLKVFLNKSIVTRDRRIGDVVSWHKALSKLMFDGDYSPTTFNIAFYMHNLFREDIERETREIEVEKTIEIPVGAAVTATAPPAPVPSPSDDFRDSTGVREGTLAVRERYGIAEEGEKKSKFPMLMAVAGIAVIGLAAVGYFLFGRGDGTPTNQAATTPAAVTAAPDPEPVTAPVEAEPAGPTSEEIAVQINSIFDAKQKEMQAESDASKKSFEDEIGRLRAELSKAQEKEKQREEVATPPVPKPVETKEPTAEPAKKEPEATTQVAEKEPAPKATTPTTTPKTTPANKPATVPKAAVRTGDLVKLSEAGVRPPTVKTRASARVPPLLKRMKKKVTAKVRILVDENGKVIDAQMIEKVGFGVDKEAVRVAKNTVYNPATKDGTRVKIWIVQTITFSGV